MMRSFVYTVIEDIPGSGTWERTSIVEAESEEVLWRQLSSLGFAVLSIVPVREYWYKVRDASGTVRTAITLSPNETTLVSRLEDQGFWVLKVREEKKNRGCSSIVVASAILLLALIWIAANTGGAE